MMLYIIAGGQKLSTARRRKIAQFRAGMGDFASGGLFGASDDPLHEREIREIVLDVEDRPSCIGLDIWALRGRDVRTQPLIALNRRFDERKVGVGLGLAVAKGFTEAMGGTIRTEDTPSGGLTVVISLPAADSPAPVPTGDPVPGDAAPITAGSPGAVTEDAR